MSRNRKNHPKPLLKRMNDKIRQSLAFSGRVNGSIDLKNGIIGRAKERHGKIKKKRPAKFFDSSI